MQNLCYTLRETVANPSIISTLRHQNLESEPGQGRARQKYQIQICRLLWVNVAFM
jgi:hypothetical protein